VEKLMEKVTAQKDKLHNLFKWMGWLWTLMWNKC